MDAGRRGDSPWPEPLECGPVLTRPGESQGSLRSRTSHWSRPGKHSTEMVTDLTGTPWWEFAKGSSPRAVPLSMAKRRVLRELMDIDPGQDRVWKTWQVTHQKKVTHLLTEFKNTLSYLELWRRSLHTIEGRFGTGICSYFSIVRFLVLLNVCSFLLVAGLVVIPLIVHNNHRPTAQSATPVEVLSRMNCSRYEPMDPGLVHFHQLILNVFSGTGFMENSLLFYGIYPKRLEFGGTSFTLGLTYLLTYIGISLGTFGCIVQRAALGYKRSILLSDGGFNNYSHKVFCGWDFCIRQPQAVQHQHSSLRTELRLDLEASLLRRMRVERTTSQNVLLITRRVIVNLLILTIIGAAFYCIYIATEVSQSHTLGEGVTALLMEYLPSMVITAANFVTPILFQLLVTLERLSAASEVKLTLLRCVFLKMASLGVLFYSLWNRITCHGQVDSDPQCQLCGYNYKQYQCWETRIGQEMYKLMIFDFLTIAAVIVFVDFPRKMFLELSGWKLAQMWGQQQFIVPHNVVELLYGQTLGWAGGFYTPLLPLLQTAKLVCVFHLKKLTLLTNCGTGERSFRSTETTFFFLLFLVMGFVLGLIPVLYGISSITPSAACGPFRGQTRIWDVVPEEIFHLPPTPQAFLQFLGSLAFLIPLFILSCLLLLFLMVRASGLKHSLQQLKARLKQEGRDKQFLLQKLSVFKLSPS